MRIILLPLLLALPFISIAQSNNAGFVQGLWYDQDKLFDAVPVRLYAAVRNNTGGEMSGTVTFYIDDDILTRKSVTALDGRIVESWADWTPTYGEHAVRAELSRLEISYVDGEEERITVTSPLAEDVLFVDYDTDGDGVGNTTDTDDDGDGVSDEDEAAAGTDPLAVNEPVPDSDADDEASSAGEEEERSDNTTEKSPTTPAGLEQYLTPSRAETLLSSITDWTIDTKQQVDTYRNERSHEAAVATNDPDLPVNEDGFGEIVRSSNSQKVAEKPEGFFGDLITLIGAIIAGVTTAVLATVSWTLSYPVLIQLGLLFGLLYLTYRLAKKFGGRPS